MADKIDSDGDGLITYQEAVEYARVISPINDPDQESFSTSTIIKVKSAAKAAGASLTGAASDFLNSEQNPDGTVQKAVNAAKEWVWGTIVVPLFSAWWIAFAGISAAIGMIYWGSDLALEERVQGVPGLADLPIAVANLAIDATAPIGQTILVFVHTTNHTLVTAIVSEGGALAPVLTAGLGMLELGFLLAVLWSGVRIASSLPVVSTVVAVADVVTRPLRPPLRRFR